MGSLMVLAVLGTFMALDKTVGHWYVPEEAETPVEPVAQYFLGHWDKSIPQTLRDEDTRRQLTGEGSTSSGDTSAQQLRSALHRIANAAALPLIRQDLAGLNSPKLELERLTQCIGYLLGTNETPVACNMQSIVR